jgi:hypothetical protein
VRCLGACKRVGVPPLRGRDHWPQGQSLPMLLLRARQCEPSWSAAASMPDRGAAIARGDAGSVSTQDCGRDAGVAKTTVQTIRFSSAPTLDGSATAPGQRRAQPSRSTSETATPASCLR